MVKVVLSNDQMKCCKTVLCPSKMLKENNWPVLNSGENFTSIIPFSSQLSCKVSIFLKMLNIKMSSIREIPFLLLRVPSLPRAARYLAQGRGTAREPGRAPHPARLGRPAQPLARLGSIHKAPLPGRAEEAKPSHSLALHWLFQMLFHPLLVAADELAPHHRQLLVRSLCVFDNNQK